MCSSLPCPGRYSAEMRLVGLSSAGLRRTSPGAGAAEGRLVVAGRAPRGACAGSPTQLLSDTLRVHVETEREVV